jgi:hypothetical protein
MDMDLHGFLWISLVLDAFGRSLGHKVREPVPHCAALYGPVAADWISYILSCSGTLQAWIWRPGGLDAGCWQDWKLVAAGWEEGLEEILTRSTLQEVGGFPGLWDLP